MTTAGADKPRADERPEPGADILPDTPRPADPNERPRTEAEEIDDKSEPFGDNFA